MLFVRRSPTTLTHVERRGLRTTVNLADGHVWRGPTAAEQPILHELQDVYKTSFKYDPVELEHKFVTSYLALSGQKLPEGAQPLVFFSASEAIDVAARVLAKHGESCAVLEPTFDNIPMLLASSGVPVYPFKEALLDDIDALAREIDKVTALFVTLPNNPTGLVLSKNDFRRLCDLCAKKGKSLIVDACFRLFVPSAHFNYYEVLDNSGVDWMVVEDTGKVWATNDLKAGILVCSEKYAAEGSKAFHDLVLSISPFVLALLWQLSERGGAQAVKEVYQIIRSNRALIRSSIAESVVFRPNTAEALLPVENVFYDKTRFPNQPALIKLLEGLGLGVVGSEGFYWAGGKHEPFLRLALSRDRKTIRRGANILAQLQ